MEANGQVGVVHPPAVDEGYRAERLLGSGRASRVWAVVRNSDGARFALKVPAASPGGHGTTFETRRELNILSRFEHENLMHLSTVLETDQGPGLLMELAPGGSLGRVLRARGTLQPGEAVTVLVGIASVLAYLHGLNVCHGDVSPGNILFTASGKPLLGDLGTAALLGSGPAPAAAEEDDVLALAAVGWLIVTGRALPPAERRLPLAVLVPEIPAALAEAIDAGLEEEPKRRPDAAEFARRVFESTPAQPLDLALGDASAPLDQAPTRRSRLDQGRAPAGLRRRAGRGKNRRPGGSPGEHEGSGRSRNRMLLGAAAVLVAATMGLGAVAVAAPEMLPGAEPGEPGTPPPASDGGQSPGAQPLPPPDQAKDADTVRGAGDGAVPGSPEPSGQVSLARTSGSELELMVSSSDPVQAARALAELRARAFTAADADLLTGINTPRSPAMQADQAEISKLEAAETVLSGLAVEVVSAGPAVPGQDGRVSVRAAVSTSAYAERDARGGMVRNVAAVSSQDVVLVMVRTADGWRIEDILAPPA
ncbi:serine/threonine protein kinase [Arthrobacter gengyunqii]|uniref:Serine/threonine protein kinase n=1 Tax=Arthrobacter gengyunqii TaxID=2886940 RepID=A0A9X1S942_9MICC|nr:serine/threonine-protein kinase [Arthrobacter gengyunqii]MCC3270539.1 serine/threonine protein kinase [Arthrobacter gengyunqii]UOY97413.1 serine/threonine protein kinase [Arthrobacter gengyunqii]